MKKLLSLLAFMFVFAPSFSLAGIVIDGNGQVVAKSCEVGEHYDASGNLIAGTNCKSLSLTLMSEGKYVSSDGTYYTEVCEAATPNKGGGLSMSPSACNFVVTSEAASNATPAPAAPSSGLIPCGGSGPDQHPCQSCDVVTLANNVIAWLVGFLSAVAVLIIVYAGVKLVTANGNRHAMEEAKGMMTNLLIGYLIVLGGWLVMDFVMKALVRDAPEFGPWNTISCVDQPKIDQVVAWSNPDKYLFATNGWETVPLKGGIGPVGPGGIDKQATCPQIATPAGMKYNCTTRIAECQAQNGKATVTPAGDAVTCSGQQYTQSGGTHPPDLSAPGACAVAVVNPYFGSLTGDAQCIIQHESVCGARMISRSDVMGDGRPFSLGPMQINLTWHDLIGCGPGGATLPCTQAFTGRNYTARVTNESLYQQCAAAAQNVACNLQNGRLIYNAGYHGVKPSWGAWSTASECGLH